MALRSKRTTLFALAIPFVLIVTPPALAQVDATAALDMQVQESLDPASGTALARRQSASGDLVAAAATLERVLLNHADADDARVMHAGLLCRLDDPAGARAELAELAGRPALDVGWPDIVSACGPIDRPLVGDAK